MSEATIMQLKKIIVEDLNVNLAMEEVKEDASLFEGGIGLDSVTLVDLISHCEKRFAIQFDDCELEPGHFKTLAVLADLINKKKEEQAHV